MAKHLGTGGALDQARARRRTATGRAKAGEPEHYARDWLTLDLLERGLTYREIAAALAARFGGPPVTKQAVQQRVRRLRMAARGERVPRQR
jgi:hypothetical protein